MTPGRLAVVVGLLFLGLVAAGVLYVLSPHDVATPAASGTASPSTSPSASSSPSGTASATGQPTRLPTRLPTIGATSASRPTPTKRLPPKAKVTASPLPPPALDFTISTFNVLGASHTTGSGTKGHRFASGRVRAGRASVLIRRHGADVVGFQELQSSQLATLRRTTDFDFYPGFSLRRLDSENSLGWDRTKFTAVQKRTFRIPYFNGGARAMPVVLLRSISTGLEAWFMNVHNPADTARFHRQQRFRTRATSIEVQLTNSLLKSGLPVFLTGDMNERASFFCRYTARTPMRAARGGSNNGRCLVGRPRAVDWILGSPDVTFSDYQEDRSRLVDITTDHPVVSARVHMVGKAATR